MNARSFGVEEELLLVDPVAAAPVAAGDDVVTATVRRTGVDADRVDHEFKEQQAELGSVPALEAEPLRADLIRLRRAMATGAAATGVRIAALATSPLPTRPSATDDERYHRMTAEFAVIAREQLTCGQHVHVSVDSPEEGVAVLDRIRTDLATILALSANSPFFQGQDTGYASYRTMLWGRWPTAGPTERFGDPARYRQVVDTLIASGAALDTGMIYFDARLSASYPTVEVRVADVCTDVDDAVAVAVLIRALVETAVRDWRSGVPAPDVRVEVLRGAAWRAARSGLAGELFDVRAGRLLPALDAVGALVDRVGPALSATGDRALVDASLQRWAAVGTGADRQRAAAAAVDGSVRESLIGVVDDVVRRTVVPDPVA
ncbi:carboxylate-amine ligase [Nakamurella leprariae]|uniref:Putative glutamate--cysteine ligase 2 n=1 Tax=Nakamurella leprariae TaxID=2803911 RepID=A0A938YJP6_9ACTN|nr:glutamate--cysteine ligase [Nakamurella leprariae]MBM9469040.1 glutamate--cysteine ligase [Nakamurella leprariae]